MKKLIPGLCVLSLTSIAFSTTITSVTQSEKPDDKGYYTVQIDGTGFGKGPNMVLFDDFEQQTVGEAVDLAKPLHGKWESSTVYKHRPKIVEYEKGKVLQVRDFDQPGSRAAVAQVEAVFPEKINSVFFSYSVVVPEGYFFAGADKDETFPDASSWKFTWVCDTPSGMNQTKFNICVPTHAGRGSFLLAGNSVNHGWISMAESWSWHTKNYMSFGMIANAEQPQDQPGHIIFELTGKEGKPLFVNKNDKPIYPKTNTTSFDRVRFPGWIGNGSTENFNAYYDDIYVATGPDAMARVEFSDAQDKPKSIINLTLPIVEWTPERITVRLHKNNVKEGKPAFIRVYDNKNQPTISPIKR